MAATIHNIVSGGQGTKGTNRNLLKIISYNMHGYNQGRPGVADLIEQLGPDVVLVQEHWLSSDNLSKLNEISDLYFVFGSSAMDMCISTGPLRGRPFGGTAILINKMHAAATVNLVANERYNVIKLFNWLIINVYLPCSGTLDRNYLYTALLSELQIIIDENSENNVFIGGDFNTDLNAECCVSNEVNSFITDNNLYRCDLLYPTANKFTFSNETAGSRSCIDFMLTSNSTDTVAFNIIDIDINLSDHLPLLAVCSCDSIPLSKSAIPTEDVTHLRWDRAPLHLYYEQTRLLLQPVMDEVNLLSESLSYYSSNSVNARIDCIYESIVDALTKSSSLFIPKHKKNFYKFWWSQELDILKEKSIESCRAWKDAGRPRNGPIQTRYRQDKLRYKNRIREEQAQEQNVFSNDLHEALMHKQGQDFWKIWKSKFDSKTNNIIQVNGTADGSIIVNDFANHFEKICTPTSAARNIELKEKYLSIRADYHGCPLTDDNQFDVSLISDLVAKMKRGKAAGLDELTCEHLQFSHPIVIVILCKLFNVFLNTGHIPSSFGRSYTVPIPKCDGRSKALLVDDFRGISISPVISKLFELSILDRFAVYLESSDNQFGFKKALSCSHAIYNVRNVIEQFISNSCTVNICTLDLSKAFDRMNHFALFIKLMDRKLPTKLLQILEMWFDMCQSCVKWGGHVSHFYKLLAGVRQGGVLSPFLFAIFIDDIVDRVKAANVGCYISSICTSIFLFADDILLVSPTVSGLQTLLTVCERELTDIDMYINVKKSMCMRFGPRFNAQCTNLISVNGATLQWVESCRYLGVYFVSGRTFKFSFHIAKVKFFRAFNAVYSKIAKSASNDVILSLLRAKCLPCLLYALEACSLLASDKHSFEFAITRTFMKMFRTGSPAVVQECQAYFGFLPIKSQIELRTARFLQKFTVSSNSLCQLFAERANIQLNAIFLSHGPSVNSLCDLRGKLNKDLQLVIQVV